MGITEKLRVGVVGVGHLGQYHAQKYSAISLVDLVGVVDTDYKRAKEIATRNNTNAFYDYHDFFGKVDAVSLAVPTDRHFEIGMDLMTHGIHVLMEKPITYEIERADILVKTARDNNLVLQIGLVERFNPAVVKMETLLNGPVFIESHRMNPFTNRGLDVDVVLDLMIHDLDIFLHIVPSEVKNIHATGMSIITPKTDVANARIIFENGTVANLTASRVADKALRKIRIFQNDCYMSVNCSKRTLSHIKLNINGKTPDAYPELASSIMEFNDSDPLADEVLSFVESVINRTEPVVTGEDGRRALYVALEIIDQIEKGSKEFKAINIA